MGQMRSSPYQVTLVVRWLSEAPSRPSRQIVGKARSRLIPESDLASEHLVNILAVDSALSRKPQVLNSSVTSTTAATWAWCSLACRVRRSDRLATPSCIRGSDL